MPIGLIYSGFQLGAPTNATGGRLGPPMALIRSRHLDVETRTRFNRPIKLQIVFISRDHFGESRARFFLPHR